MLLLEAKDLRNTIEHYEFKFEQRRFRVLCTDFLAICVLLAQALLAVNLADVFCFDFLRDKTDPVGAYLASALDRVSSSGREAIRKAGELWVAANPTEPVFLCLICGARAIAVSRGVCMACGAEGDGDLAALLEDFAATTHRLSELERARAKNLGNPPV